MTMRDVMTPEQVAEHLQVSTDTIYRLIRGRELAASKVGRAWRIRRQDVDEFLADQSTRAEIIEKLFRQVDTFRVATHLHVTAKAPRSKKPLAGPTGKVSRYHSGSATPSDTPT